MKRRSFCASAISLLTTAAVPWHRSFVANAAGELPALGHSGKQVLIQASDIDDLRAGLRGQLLVPGQDGYDAARKIWNGAFDRRPALIARCSGAADIARSVQFARAHDLLVAVLVEGLGGKGRRMGEFVS